MQHLIRPSNLKPLHFIFATNVIVIPKPRLIFLIVYHRKFLSIQVSAKVPLVSS
uniref:Uncharacterized protein n=1 Tax=Glossina brevipalpis TaxID=37001 RepID=A0A1A9WB30_9MUSC